MENEVSVLSQLDHNNISSLLNVLEDEKRVYLVLELGGSTNLSTFNWEHPVIGETQARSIFRQIVSAVNHIHIQNFCHRDLKLSNILISKKSWKVKVVDFGFSVDAAYSLEMYCGTPSYMAPEIMKGVRYFGKDVDAWALGVILYKLVEGKYPFGSTKDLQLKHNVLTQKPTFSEHLSRSLVGLLKLILEKDPKKRISIGEVIFS